MFRRNSILALLILLPSVAAAQEIQADQKNYCDYLTEQAKAQSDLLRSPTLLGGLAQAETGLPTQLLAGAQLSLSNLKKAGITLDAARKNCALYNASSGVLLTLQYALAGYEKDALAHRLTLIGASSKALDELIGQTIKMVAAQNMTRPMLLAAESNRIKLEADRADTQSRIAALYMPPLSNQPLKLQVAAKQASDIDEQKVLARLARQSNWDVALTVGTHQQVNPPAEGLQPYGEVSLSYNLGSRAIDRHLDRSVEAYGNWKKVQETDVVRGMEVLRDQVRQSIAAQQERLQSLAKESVEIDENLKLAGDAESSAALDFRNQLTCTKLLLTIETGDAAYRLDRLREFLDKNF
ncbi:MAG: hypothetical protein ABR991_07065 [Terracidiphilus sp.]|jgi:hypothetical protein